MYRTIAILIISFVLLSTQLKATCIEFTINLDKDLDGLTNKSCNNNPKCGLNENLFNYTHSKTELSQINGVKVYTINQNDDSRYNVGYSYGKSVLINNPDYSKELKEFLSSFRELQSEYKLDEVLSTISKSLPCWITVEMEGFADAASVNNDNITITYEDIVLLNTIVLWTKLPQKDPKAPPAAPTSITPIKLKKKELQTSLSPISTIADQDSYVISLDKSLIKEETPVVIRNYSREYSNFFNKTQAIIIYHLDNSSFMSVGIEGLVSVISGINEYGVSIHTIQATDQQNETIIGATPPSILTRMALESAETAIQANKILNHVKPSLEQAFIIVDKDNQFVINSEIQNNEEKPMYETISPNKIIIYNFSNDESNKEKLSTVNFFELLTSPINFDEVIETINTSNKIQNTNEKNIFNTVFNIKEKEIWLQGNSGILTKNFAKVGFNTINGLKEDTEEKNQKDNMDE